MYIRFNTITKRVVYIDIEKPINIEDGTFQVAQVESVPSEYDWLTYEYGKLMPHFVSYTSEQIEAQKYEKYKSLVEMYIREKYSQSDVEALQANLLSENVTEKDKLEWQEFQLYRTECKARAKAEVYGV